MGALPDMYSLNVCEPCELLHHELLGKASTDHPVFGSAHPLAPVAILVGAQRL